MIPSMIVFGLVLGRWWKVALIGAAIFWPALLLWAGPLQESPGSQPLVVTVLLASGLGVANAAVGVGAHQLVLRLFRSIRHSLDETRR